jgi:hypothetical protein
MSTSLVVSARLSVREVGFEELAGDHGAVADQLQYTHYPQTFGQQTPEHQGGPAGYVQWSTDQAKDEDDQDDDGFETEFAFFFLPPGDSFHFWQPSSYVWTHLLRCSPATYLF